MGNMVQKRANSESTNQKTVHRSFRAVHRKVTKTTLILSVLKDWSLKH